MKIVNEVTIACLLALTSCISHSKAEVESKQPPKSNEWTLVFKGVEGNGDNLYSLWNSNYGWNEERPGARSLTSGLTYKSHLVDRWEAIGVTEAKLVLYKNRGEALSMHFNGVGTTKNSWFSKKHLRAAPWQDLMDSDTVQFFAIVGDEKYNRRFFVNKNYGGCNSDVGWLVVVDVDCSTCSWSNRRTKPYFMYSGDVSNVNYASGNVAYADVMAVYIKYRFEYRYPPEDDWELVFKAVSGAGGSVYDLWAGNGGRNENNDQAKELNKDVRDHYKSAKVDRWAYQGIKQVKVAVYEDSHEKMYMIFNARNSDKFNWFSKSRLTATSYTDLNSGTGANYFSIPGYAKYSRHFYVNKHHGGCPNAAGWLVVADRGYVYCDWMTMEPRPYFLYGKARTSVYYQRGSAHVGRGDVFAIFIRN